MILVMPYCLKKQCWYSSTNIITVEVVVVVVVVEAVVEMYIHTAVRIFFRKIGF